jgi:hypothetical protein
VQCEGEATCKGGCDVDYEEPKCEGKLDPPECTMDADCKAGCEGRASLEAKCTPPRIVITGTANADFAASLEAHLPAIYGVRAKLELVGEAAGKVGDAALSLAGELAGSVGCLADYGESFLAQLRASADVSVEVQASASASAEVSGSTSGG